jgi:CheY-like chemotaxis protein
VRRPGTIGVVDDDRRSRRKPVIALRSRGNGAFGADSGAAAPALPQDGDSDLVLLDIVMPGMDGFQVLTQKAADPVMPEAPVPMISGIEAATDGVARAIAPEAPVFLPETFEANVCRARVTAGGVHSA